MQASEKKYDAGKKKKTRHSDPRGRRFSQHGERAAGVRRLGAPIGIWGRYDVERADHAFDRIVDIGEIAGVLAVVEHLDRLARELLWQSQRNQCQCDSSYKCLDTHFTCLPPYLSQFGFIFDLVYFIR